MTGRGVGAALVLLLGACGPHGPPPIGEFSAPQIASSETANGATPMYLVAPSGLRLLSWVTAPRGGNAGELAVSVTPADGAPRPVVRITDPLGPIAPHGEAPPQFAADASGRLYGLYVVGKAVPGERFPRSALRLTRSEDGGRTWGAPVTVNEGEAFGSHNFHSILAAPDGAVYVSWLGSAEPGGTSSLIWLRSSRDGGRSWGPVRPLDADAACPCCRSALALGPDGSLYVAWRKVFPGDIRDVVVSRSRDGGATWSDPVRPRADDWVYPGCPHAGPSLRVDAAGTLHVAWWTGKRGEAGVWYARSDDQGARFVAQPIATGATSSPAHVQVAPGPSGPVVVWDDGHSEVPRILLRASGDQGRSFARAILLSGNREAGSLPVLAVERDSIRVAWSSKAGSAGESHAGHAGDPDGAVPLPRVGQQEIVERVAPLVARVRPRG